jgi:hypothetical protein
VKKNENENFVLKRKTKIDFFEEFCLKISFENQKIKLKTKITKKKKKKKKNNEK